jgi:predicted transcriptional regulator
VIRRNSFITAMEVLAALREGPLSSSRLAQRCNINYGRLNETVDPLLANGWIGKEKTGGQEVHTLTENGLRFLLQYLVVSNEYQRGVKLTSGQEGF